MSKSSKVTRRSFVRTVSGSALGLTFSSLITKNVHAQQSGLTDNDPNDDSGYGSRGRSGVTDSDPTTIPDMVAAGTSLH